MRTNCVVRAHDTNGPPAATGRGLPFGPPIGQNPERPFKLSTTQSGRRRRLPHHGHHRVRSRQDRRTDRDRRGDPRAQARREHRLPGDRGPPRGGWCGLELAGLPAARDLRRPRVGQPPLRHRRQRVHRLPPRLRRDGGRACAPQDRRGDAEASGARHAFRAADEGPRRDRREPVRSLQAAAVAVRQLGDRDHARGDPADARQHRARHDHQDRGHLSRPPRLDHVQRGARTAPRSARANTRSPCTRRWASRRRSPTWCA